MMRSLAYIPRTATDVRTFHDFIPVRGRCSRTRTKSATTSADTFLCPQTPCDRTCHSRGAPSAQPTSWKKLIYFRRRYANGCQCFNSICPRENTYLAISTRKTDLSVLHRSRLSLLFGGNCTRRPRTQRCAIQRDNYHVRSFVVRFANGDMTSRPRESPITGAVGPGLWRYVKGRGRSLLLRADKPAGSTAATPPPARDYNVVSSFYFRSKFS
jgi:hypothetical protein